MLQTPHTPQTPSLRVCIPRSTPYDNASKCYTRAPTRQVAFNSQLCIYATPTPAALPVSQMLVFPMPCNVLYIVASLPLPQFQHSNYITTHFPPQHPLPFSDSLISILPCGPLIPETAPEGFEDMSLLYLRISRTISWKAASTLVRDFADVSMNLQPNCRASDSPSMGDTNVSL